MSTLSSVSIFSCWPVQISGSGKASDHNLNSLAIKYVGNYATSLMKNKVERLLDRF